MKKLFIKTKNWIFTHKKTSVVLLLVLVSVGYGGAKKITAGSASAKYIMATVERGEFVSVVTGTGQVSASNQVEVAAQVSGEVVSVPVKMGQRVNKNQLLAYLDSADASRQVEDAKLGLENAKLSYEKALKQSQDQASDSSVSDLKKAYDNGYTAVVDTFIDLPDIIEGVDAIYYDPTHSAYFNDTQLSSIDQMAIDYKYDAGRIFDQAKKDYDSNFKTYKSVSIDQQPEKVVALIKQTYETVRKLSSALTGAYNTIDYVKSRLANVPTQVATDKSTLNSYITKLNDHADKLSNALTDIEDAKDSATTATLDMKSAEIAVSKAQATLRDSETALADHGIRSPFDGIVAEVSVETGDKISVNNPVATLITDQKIAEVSLNEVDVSKVKAGQDATVTFDAIEGLVVRGKVTEVDLLGTVEQGVVSYKTQITLDSNDERIKPGMSLSADITTGSEENVLLVPNSAVKSQGENNYVEILDEATNQPKKVPVKISSSNDRFTEVSSGLSEGQKVISKTVTSTSSTPTTQAPSLFGGARTGGTGNVRLQTR